MDETNIDSSIQLDQDRPLDTDMSESQAAVDQHDLTRSSSEDEYSRGSCRHQLQYADCEQDEVGKEADSELRSLLDKKVMEMQVRMDIKLKAQERGHKKSMRAMKEHFEARLQAMLPLVSNVKKERDEVDSLQIVPEKGSSTKTRGERIDELIQSTKQKSRRQAHDGGTSIGSFSSTARITSSHEFDVAASLSSQSQKVASEERSGNRTAMRVGGARRIRSTTRIHRGFSVFRNSLSTADPSLDIDALRDEEECNDNDEASNAPSQPQHTQTSSQSQSPPEMFGLDRDTFSLMMISKPWSREWLLGIITSLVFQLGLGTMIVINLVHEYNSTCYNQFDKDFNFNMRKSNCVPFNVPIWVPLEVTLAQFITIIIVIATQSDLLTSVTTLVTLRKNAEHVRWDELIGEPGNRSWLQWTVRIMFPNAQKLSQGLVISFASFVIIVQSNEIIDLLKDFSALLVVSEADNIIFYLADMGFLGEHLAMKTLEVRGVQIEIPSMRRSSDKDKNVEQSNRRRLSLTKFEIANSNYTYLYRNIFFGIMCFSMIGGWSFFVHGQRSGAFVREKYQGCNVPDPFRIGDGRCDEQTPYNSIECDHDGGDCVAGAAMYPKCFGNFIGLLGDGICTDWPPYNSVSCGYDGGDCPTPVEVENYPGCFVVDPSLIGNGWCDEKVPYNTLECKYDGGDCQPVDGYSLCYVDDPNMIGDGDCFDRPPYNSLECGYDGGDCS